MSGPYTPTLDPFASLEREDEDEDGDWRLDAYYQSSYSTRTALVVVVDCNAMMLQPLNHVDLAAGADEDGGESTDDGEDDDDDDDDLENGDTVASLARRRTPFYMVMQSLRRVLQERAVDSPADLVGIIFYNTRESSAATLPGGGSSSSGNSTSINDHIYALAPLEEVDPALLLKVWDLGAGRFDFDGQIGSVAPEKGAMIAQVMTKAMQALRNVKGKVGAHRILWITNQVNPHAGDAHARKTARTRFMDAANAAYQVAPYFIPPPGQKDFDLEPFWADTLGLARDFGLPMSMDTDELSSETSSLNGLSATSSLLADTDQITVSRKMGPLLRAMRSRETKKRTVFRVPFHLTDATTVGVCGYALYARATKPREIKILAANNRPVVSSPPQTLCETTGMVLNPATQTVCVYGYAGTSAKLTPQEAGMIRGGVPWTPSLRLLGFKRLSKLKRTHNLTHSTFVFPDESAYKGSVTALVSLREAMLLQGTFALVRSYPRRGTTPRFSALVPQRELRAPDGAVLAPAGFFLVQLPFRDELRKLSKPQSGIAALEPEMDHNTAHVASVRLDALSAALERLVSRWRARSFDPRDFSNPSVANMVRLLHAKALDRPDALESATGEREDAAMVPDYERWHARCANLAKQTKALIPVPETSAKGRAKSKADAAPTLDVTNMCALAANGKLQTLKVDELKAFLRSVNLRPAGNKATLIDVVKQYLNEHQ